MQNHRVGGEKLWWTGNWRDFRRGRARKWRVLETVAIATAKIEEFGQIEEEDEANEERKTKRKELIRTTSWVWCTGAGNELIRPNSWVWCTSAGNELIRHISWVWCTGAGNE
ncbi:hypothetical protein QN277_015889 [Acacia crassicarpa]|uniref:Uncharacterized protein n=1 Tax=Acacia crassicarpa TaxID=499986 RepID=A0AAE1JV46_9FABA|nr:hypothetical protein QN277_015889 [Acacia crassicarpa]